MHCELKFNCLDKRFFLLLSILFNLFVIINTLNISSYIIDYLSLWVKVFKLLLNSETQLHLYKHVTIHVYTIENAH